MYDPQIPGNNYNLTLRDGKIVAMMGWQGLTVEQLPLLPEEPMQPLFVKWGEQEVKVFGVTVEDAMEALRRWDDNLAFCIRAGETRLFRKVEEAVEVAAIPPAE